MKKLILILFLVSAYGVTLSTASPKIIKADKAKTTVVADSDKSVTTPQEKDKKKKKAKVETKSTCVEKADCSKNCCSDAHKSCCPASHPKSSDVKKKENNGGS